MVNCRPYKTTSDRRTNLEKLAEYLEQPRLAAEFSMRQFATEPTALVTTCGTAGCAVGHAPYAGIQKYVTEGWYGYSFRTLIPENCADDDDDFIRAEWNWCFSDEWTEVDDSPAGAAARIRWLLDKGLPSNWWAQMNGGAPLCYREGQ